MINQHYFRIHSTEDIAQALKKAEQEDLALDFFNSIFLIRGERGRLVSVDDSLAGLHVVALGPAPVRVSGGGELAVIAEETATVYAAGDSAVHASDSATVYAYDRAEVIVRMEASVYVSSDDVYVEAWEDSKVYLPAKGSEGAEAEVRVADRVQIIRGVDNLSETRN